MFIWLNTMPIESTRKGMSGATTRSSARCDAVGASAFERRRDVHQHAIARAAAAEFQVRERRGGQIRGTMRAQIFFGDAAEEGARGIPG